MTNHIVKWFPVSVNTTFVTSQLLFLAKLFELKTVVAFFLLFRILDRELKDYNPLFSLN